MATTEGNLIPILVLCVERVGGNVTELARRLGVKRPTLYSWKEVPPKRVLDLEKITNIPRHLIRPDIYPEPGK